MKTYIIFYNKNGNKKLAVDIENTTVENITTKSFINAICDVNNYTFVYKQLKENCLELKNIPIIKIAMFGV